MITVKQVAPGQFEPIAGDRTVESLDQGRRASLATILNPSWSAADRAAFGIFQVDTEPPAGARWTGGFAESEGVPVAVFEPIPIGEARAARWQEVKTLRTAAEFGGCATPLGRVQTDERSIAKINGLVTMAMLAQAAAAPFAIDFTLEDNSVVTLDAADAIALGTAAGAFVAAVYARSFELRTAIDAAADSAALDAIDIEAGWPE